jgi:NhaA family Na+:H+ antiporter
VLKVLLKPFQQFLQLEAAGSLLLLLATVSALGLANSPWRNLYEIFWHSPLPLSLGNVQFSLPSHFWLNEGLMTLFFLLVGLEIKREILTGELSTPRQASLPILGALGGMIIPAGIYALLNPPGSAFARGWGIPTVTDIAFAVGALTLLGKRVPLGLKVFLVALAIVDDVGAIVIIALFYSQGIQPLFLLVAASILLVACLLNRARVYQPWPYLILGVFLWLALLQSGIHPTIAGVLLALTVPASMQALPSQTDQQATAEPTHRLAPEDLKSPALLIPTKPPKEKQGSDDAMSSPLQRIAQGLHPWVTYGILPLFALANAGVHLPWGQIFHSLRQPLALGIIAGLFLGKPLGITLAAWAAVRLGWATLPAQVTLRQIHAAGVLGGIGFTMSVFINLLAFREPSQVASAKLAILLASGLSAIVGVSLLWLALEKNKPVRNSQE